MKTAQISRQGLKHEQNQDSCLCAEKGLFCKKLLLCVADGMGGLQNGEESSRTVIEKISSTWHSAGKIENALDEAILEAHRRILRSSDKNGIRSGSTVALAIISKKNILVKNVGDSRVVRVTDTGESLLSQDDTLIRRMVETGEITPEQAKNHPKAHVLTQCVGTGSMPVIHTAVYPRMGQESLFVMSDGVYNRLQTGELTDLAAQLKKGNDRALENLITVLRSRGERDDITLLSAF